MEVETLQGEKFTVNMKDGKATITGGDILPAANVIGTDVMASNGVVHVIDMVLIPPTISTALKADMTPNIVELAAGQPEFKTLVAAVKAAGLADALAAEGPFTIMAPNDAAFEAAFKALGITAEEALENPALGDILKYHAVSGKVMAADVKDGMEVETLQGEKFTVNMKDGKATITGGDILPAANIIGTDVMASNGVVHVIDMVLIPPTISTALKADMTPNIVELAASQPDFKTLVAAVKAAGLADALAGEGPFTIMAPNDAAFEAAFKALGITAEEALKNPALGDILKYHAVSGKVMAADLKYHAVS